MESKLNPHINLDSSVNDLGLDFIVPEFNVKFTPVVHKTSCNEHKIKKNIELF